MAKFIMTGKTLLMSFAICLLAVNCAKQKTSITVVPNSNVPTAVADTTPTTTPGVSEKLTTSPICTVPLIFPTGQATTDNEANLGDLIVQPTWTPSTSKIQAPSQIEPPTMICLFVDSTGSKPKASLRLEYEDRYGRVQYTLKDSSDLDYSKQVNASTAPPVKKDTNGNTVIYMPSYYVDLSETNFEIFFMPTWGFITIKGAKQADGFFYATIKYIKFLNAPIEPYYLTFSDPADATKIQHCTGDDGQNSMAMIVHPDRPTQAPVECARAHRFVRSAYNGPWDSILGVFQSNNVYTGNPYDYRVSMIRQYTDERPEALADFQTALGQKPKTLGSIKFTADQVWAGVAP